MFDPRTQLFVAVVLALLPGLFTWWKGRPLLRSLGDPALPELLMAKQQRVSLVLVFCVVFLVAFGGANVYWAVPLQVLGLVVGGYPLGRVLLGESTRASTYVWSNLKSVFGAFGFWLALGATPLLVVALGKGGWPLSIAWLALLLIWEWRYPRLWLRMHDAVPLDDPVLQSRLDAIVAKSGLQPPATYRIGTDGRRLVSAVALPSVRQPAIAMGNGLLELLPPDEVAAIFAHELAHIEQYSPRIVRGIQRENWFLIIGAVVGSYAITVFAPASSSLLLLVWPFVSLMVLSRRGSRRQAQETESDLRAAALCGDPEVVVRALAKLHVHAFIPRRWAVDFERNASHPSLARRIQALRGEESPAVPQATRSAVLETAREGSLVLLDARAYWFDGVPAGVPHEIEALRAAASSYRAVQYPDLVELRVVANDSGRALKAVHRNGDAWSVPLQPSQVAAVQQALDQVDVRLHRDLGRRTFLTPRLVATLILMASLIGGDFGLLLVPLALVFWRPGSATLAALGAMALAQGALGALGVNESWIPGAPVVGSVAVMALGATAAWMAFQRVRRDGLRDNARLALIVFGALSVALLAASVWQLTVMTPAVVMAEPLSHALTVTLLGVAAAFAVTDRRGRWRVGALVTAAIVWATVTAASLVRPAGAPVLANSVGVGRIVASDSVDGAAVGLRLSPGGRRFMVSMLEGRRRRATADRPQMRMRAFGTEGRDIDALAAEFLDDEQLLALREEGDSLELSLEPADRDTSLWKIALPRVSTPSLSLSLRDSTWMVSGDDYENEAAVVVTGVLGRREVRIFRLPSVATMEGLPPMVFHGGDQIVVPEYGRVNMPPILFALFGARALRSELSLADSGGLRPIATLNGFPQCGTVEGGSALCLVRARNRIEMWAVSDSARVQAKGTLPSGPIGVSAIGPGARLAAAAVDGTILLANVDSGWVRRVTVPDTAGYVSELKVAGNSLVVLRQVNARAVVTLYRIAVAPPR